ncbi:transmembrane protein 87A [Oryza brachyantha]|uniref:transmembrane protein 87A n=1 Tax=Oryza brachyantha TaxID=4533 RepID=UPI001AD9BBF0|nr:transmembrane protein 87A [Oryza brachyantha]
MSMTPSMGRRRLLHVAAAVAVVVVSCAVLCAEASVHEYSGERFASVGNGFVLHGGSEGVYASPSAESFVRFEKVAFRRTPEAASVAEEDGNRTVTVTAVIFEAGDRDAVGGSDVGGERALCCTPAMARQGGCTEGAVVYRAASSSTSTAAPPAGSGWPKVLAASFPPGILTAAFPDETVAVTRTGMYSLHFVHCDPSLAAGQVAAEGKTIWKNSHGYLPGRMAPLKPFYGGMSLAFAALAASWFARYARFWREVSPLQNFATAAIALGMVEVTTWYFDLAEFDESGVRPAGTTFWAATSGAVRGAAGRVLVLLVAMGYGVTRPALGCTSARVAGLGAAYLAAAEVLEVGENVGIVSDHSPARRLFFILPVAVLNTVFIYWIFSSLSRTLTKLKARRMTAKLEMYRKFTNSLIITVALSLGWITFEVHFKSTDEHSERWRVAWVIPAVWQLISFALLCAICLLWAPSQNSMRFAYSGEESEEDADHHDDDDVEDTRPLIRPGPLSYVDNWACYVTQDAKIILRTDSGVYAKAGEELKRV